MRKAGYPVDAGAVLLIELEGPGGGDRHRGGRRRGGVPGASLSRREGGEERRRAGAALEGAKICGGRVRPDDPETTTTQDAVVPRTRLTAVLKEIAEIGSRHGVRVPNVFHAGDGNIHPLLCYDDRVPGQYEQGDGPRATRSCGAVSERAETVSGEHGIGLESAKYLRLMYTEDDLAAMQRIRQVLDPDRPLQIPERSSPRPSPGGLRHDGGDRGTNPGATQRSPRGRRTSLMGAAASRYRLEPGEPSVAVLPDDEAEVSGVLALASEGGLVVVPWGAEATNRWGNFPSRYDVALGPSSARSGAGL